MLGFDHYIAFAVHGAAGSHDEQVLGAVEQFLAFIENLARQSPGEIFATVLPGISAMANIHPLFVHFPIAFFSAFVLIDLAGSLLNKRPWRQLAGGFLYLGTIMAAATVAAGLQAAQSVPHGDDVHAIMERHEAFGISILILSAVLSLWRLLARGLVTGGANVLFLLLALILGGLVVLTADLGGLMVYKFGVAVEVANPAMPGLSHDHSHSHAH